MGLKVFINIFGKAWKLIKSEFVRQFSFVLFFSNINTITQKIPCNSYPLSLDGSRGTILKFIREILTNC